MWLIYTNCATHSSPPPRWWNSVGEQVEKNSMRFFLLSWFPGGRVDMFKHGIYSALIYLSDCAVQDSWLGTVRESKPVPHSLEGLRTAGSVAAACIWEAGLQVLDL